MSINTSLREGRAAWGDGRHRGEAVIGILVFSVVGLLLGMSLALYAIGPDEGLALAMGMAIRDGNLPYRDYFENRTPALHYVVSTLFRLTPSLWLARAAVLGTNLAGALLVRRLAQELGGPRAGFWATVFYLGSALVFQGYMVLNEPFIATLLLLSLWLGWSHGRVGCAAGVAVAAIWFKQSALVPSLVIVSLLLAQGQDWRKRLVVLAGAVVGLGVPALLVWRAGIAEAMWAQTMLTNLSTLSRRWPGLSEFAKDYLALLGTTGAFWILCGAGLVQAIAQPGDRPGPSQLARALTGALLGALASALLTPASHYFLPVAALGSVAAGIGLMNLLNALAQPRHRIALIGLLIVPMLAQGATPALSVFKQGALFRQLALGRRIQMLSLPAEPILVLNHEPGYYFLARRYPPVPAFFLLSVNDTPALEDLMIASLGREVKIAVLAEKSAEIVYGRRVRQEILAHGTLVAADPGLGIEVWRLGDPP